MLRTFQFEYRIPDFIPPRCFKPRDWYGNGCEYTVEIPEVTGEQAPVAFTIETPPDHAWDRPPLAVYRWYGEQLWLAYQYKLNNTSWGHKDLEEGWQSPQISQERFWWPPELSSYSTLEQTLNKLEDWAGRWLFIDGVLHERVDEPMYVVQASTYSRSHYRYARFTTYYERQFDWRDYYPLTDVERMIEEQSLYHAAGIIDEPFNVIEKVTVLLPEAIQHRPDVEHAETDIQTRSVYLSVDQLIALGWLFQGNSTEIKKFFGEKAFKSELVTDISFKQAEKQWHSTEIVIEVTANVRAMRDAELAHSRELLRQDAAARRTGQE